MPTLIGCKARDYATKSKNVVLTVLKVLTVLSVLAVLLGIGKGAVLPTCCG